MRLAAAIALPLLVACGAPAPVAATSRDVTVDRVRVRHTPTSTGMSLAAWADLLARPVADGGLGATAALGLDGGYSTSMAIHVGELDLDLVAHRATINALRVCTR